MLFRRASVTALRGEWLRLTIWAFVAVIGSLMSYFYRSSPCSHLYAVLLLLVAIKDPDTPAVVVSGYCEGFASHTLLQYVRKKAMPKPDAVLRDRPISEVVPAINKLRRVALLSPFEVSVKEETKYCVCRKGNMGDMVQCLECFEWFHYNCLTEDYQAAYNLSLIHI